MSYRSLFLLFILLVLPGLAFLFLRIFGENRFQEIPVFNEGPPADWECKSDQLPVFELTNQLGKTINQAVFNNRISVVNFYDHDCSGVYPRSMDQQARIYNHFLDNYLIQCLSVSLAGCDSLEAIARYAVDLGSNPSKWFFLFGERSQILELGRCGLVLDINPDEVGRDNLKFVVLDRQKRIRGYYDPADNEEIDRLIAEVQILALDYNQ